MRQKLQNSKGYAESPKFLQALELFIFKKKSVATTWGSSSLDYKKKLYTYNNNIDEHQPDHITLHRLRAQVLNNIEY